MLDLEREGRGCREEYELLRCLVGNVQLLKDRQYVVKLRLTGERWLTD